MVPDARGDAHGQRQRSASGQPAVSRPHGLRGLRVIESPRATQQRPMNRAAERTWRVTVQQERDMEIAATFL